MTSRHGVRPKRVGNTVRAALNTKRPGLILQRVSEKSSELFYQKVLTRDNICGIIVSQERSGRDPDRK